MRKYLVCALVGTLVCGPYSSLAWAQAPQPAPPKDVTTVTVAATGNASPTVTVNAPPQQAPAPATNASAPAPATPATPGKPPGEPAKPVTEAPKSSPLGKAFVARTATDYKSAEEYAKILLSCKSKNSKLQMSCDEAVKSFNENPAFDEISDVKDIDELATFIRNSTEMKICPQRKTLIAYVLNGKVTYFERDLRQGEPCLFSASHNAYIASGVCGQWIGTKFGGIFTNDNSDDLKKNTGSIGLTSAELRRIVEEELRRSGSSRNERAQRDEGKQSYLDRNWPKLVTVSLLTIGGIVAWKGLARQTQEVTQNTCINGTCR